jgi:signal transduction histidine kinase
MLGWALRRTQADGGWIGVVESGSEGQLRVVAGNSTTAAGENIGVGTLIAPHHPRLQMAFTTGSSQRFAPGTAPLGQANRAAPAAVVAPLLREGRPLAVIVVERQRRAFDSAAADFLVRLADHAAIALENARLYAALKHANDAKSEFVRTVSHELKIPMTSIKGYTDLLKMVGPLNEQQDQFIGTIRNNVERMSLLVSDLADISRIESGRLKVELRPLDLRQLLPEALNQTQLRATIAAKQQTLALDLPADLPPVLADEARLTQIVTNLVSNATKYSPPGTPIALTARAENGSVKLSVIDQGYGIAPADQAKLFSQFFRSEEPNIREQTGWGLGLHITQKLIELQGGRITVKSALGQGSTFAFTMPVAPNANTPTVTI